MARHTDRSQADAGAAVPAAAEVGVEAPAADATPAAASPSTRRMRLLAVLSFPDTDELEVHLILDGRRTIGRAPASRGLVAALDATLAAGARFDLGIDPTPRWARAVEWSEEEALIVVALDEESDDRILYGIAPGTNATDAAARDARRRQPPGKPQLTAAARPDLGPLNGGR